MADFFKKVKKFFSKLFTRFSNYKNTKKWFVLYLVALTVCFLVFPIVKADENWLRMLFSGVLWRSSIIILLALIGLFCWNLSVSFKGFMTKLCSLREDEPLVDFILLWIIVSAFMWIMDWAGIASAESITTKVRLLNVWIVINWLLLLGWLVWSFISLLKLSKKTSKRTKIMNVVEENHPKQETHKPNQVTHLFDDLGDE